MEGIRRKPFQMVPAGKHFGKRITCVQIDDEREQEWFERSYRSWFKDSNPQVTDFREWQYVLVLPWSSVRLYWAGNDGMQAWRNRRTGQVIPDHCRQTGGCPEMWNGDQVRGKRELEIANLTEIAEFIVFDHHQDVARRMFPEHDFPTSS